MAETNTPTAEPTKYRLTFNGQDFSCFIATTRKSGDSKGSSILVLDPATDMPTLVRLAAATIPEAVRKPLVTRLSHVVADATEDAFVPVTDAAGNVTGQKLDPSKAAKSILDELNETLTTGRAELEKRAAEIRSKMQEVFDLVVIQKRPITEEITNRSQSLKLELLQIEKKLAPKAKKEKKA